MHVNEALKTFNMHRFFQVSSVWGHDNPGSIFSSSPALAFLIPTENGTGVSNVCCNILLGVVADIMTSPQGECSMPPRAHREQDE